MMRDSIDKSDREKLDRRVQRTRQLLRDALLALILERGYDLLTIQDITDRANLGRATFYVHYGSKDELLMNSLEKIYDGLVERMGQIPLTAQPTVNELPVQAVFEHAAQNRDLYRVMLSGEGPRGLERRMRVYIAGVVKKRFDSFFATRTPPIPIDLMAYHVAGSLTALIGWWLDSGTAYSAEYMAQTFNQLMRQGLLPQFIGAAQS